MDQERTSRNVMQTKPERIGAGPVAVFGVCVGVCADEWRLEQLVRCYVAEGQLCVFFIFFLLFSFFPSLSPLMLRATTRPTPSPFLLHYCYDIVTAVAGWRFPWEPSDDWWCCPLPGSLLGELGG